MTTSAVLVVVAGQSGAGKARFGSIVATRTGARLLRMDEMLAGDSEPEPEDYLSLLSVAGAALAGGRSVVVVAAFHTAASRRAVLKIAGDTRAALLFVECSANDEVRRRRLRDEKRLHERIAAEPHYAEVGDEIPRACQMLIDTTVGLSLWAGLAACRVESYVSLGTTPEGAQAISAG
jgi:predicted kinase